MDLDPLRHVAGIEVSPRAFWRLGQELQQKAAGSPAMTRAISARPQFLRHREAHARGDLLGAQKILMRRVFETLALERDDALVAGGVRSLVDGHGEMATAQQRARVGCFRCYGG